MKLRLKKARLYLQGFLSLNNRQSRTLVSEKCGISAHSDIIKFQLTLVCAEKSHS